MKRYKHIYFDLDRTLWDFDANSEATIKEIFEKYDLDQKVTDFDLFIIKYKQRNDEQWALYRSGKTTKSDLRKNRFANTLCDFGIEDQELAELIDTDYVRESPLKTILFPGTIEILEYLSAKYALYIITNGFKEVQHVKMENCKLSKYFKKVFTSDEVGYIKPRQEIFDHAVSFFNAKKAESLMIGDDPEVDILGARKAGIDQVFFNSVGTKDLVNATFEINSLLELKTIL